MLTFVPIHAPHPFRVVCLRGPTLCLLAVGAVLAIYALVYDFDVGAPIIPGCAPSGPTPRKDAVIRRIRSLKA